MKGKALLFKNINKLTGDIVYYKAFKHSANCKYTYDCYRVAASSESEAIALIKEKTGVICDYAMKNVGNFDHPHIIDLD